LSDFLPDAGVSGRGSAAPAAGGRPRRAGGRIVALAGTLAAMSDACGGVVSGEPVPAARTGTSSSVPPTGHFGSSGVTELVGNPGSTEAGKAGGTGGADGTTIGGGALVGETVPSASCKVEARSPAADATVLDVLCVSDPSSPGLSTRTVIE
jgi:hypothetical protein